MQHVVWRWLQCNQCRWLAAILFILPLVSVSFLPLFSLLLSLSLSLSPLAISFPFLPVSLSLDPSLLSLSLSQPKVIRHARTAIITLVFEECSQTEVERRTITGTTGTVCTILTCHREMSYCYAFGMWKSRQTRTASSIALKFWKLRTRCLSHACADGRHSLPRRYGLTRAVFSFASSLMVVGSTEASLCHIKVSDSQRSSLCTALWIGHCGSCTSINFMPSSFSYEQEFHHVRVFFFFFFWKRRKGSKTKKRTKKEQTEKGEGALAWVRCRELFFFWKKEEPDSWIWSCDGGVFLYNFKWCKHMVP